MDSETRFGSSDPDWLKLKWLVGIFVVGIVLLSLYHGWAEMYLDARESTRKPMALYRAPGGTGLHARMSLDRSPVLSGKAATLLFEFENRDTEPLRVTLRQLRTPGFSPVESGSFQLRVAQQPTRGLEETSITLAPGEALPMTVDLLPDSRFGKFVFRADGTWYRVEAGRPSSPWNLDLSDVELISPFHDFLAHTIKSLVSILGILALPALLALAGAWFQQRQQRLALEKQDHQRKIDHERQAWAKMLPVSHKNNVELYLPLISGALTIRYEYDEWKKLTGSGGNTPETPTREDDEKAKKNAVRRILFYILFSAKRRWIINEEGGGYYLRSREGEKLVIWTLADGFLYDGLCSNLIEAEDLNRLVESLEPTETLASYLRRIQQAADTPAFGRSRSQPGSQPLAKIEDVEKKLKRWLTDDHAEWWLQLMDLGSIVLLFEINRIYEFWYEKPADFPTQDLKLITEKLDKPPEKEQQRWDTIRQLLKEYAAHLHGEKILQGGESLVPARMDSDSTFANRGGHSR